MLKLLSQVLQIAILVLAFALLVSLLPSPNKEYPIYRCDGPQTTYDPAKGPNGVIVAARRIVCFVHRNREDVNAWSTFVIAAFTIILSVFTVRLSAELRTSDRRRSGDANAPRNPTPRSAAATMSAAGRSGGCKYETDSAYLSSVVGGLGAP